ncbi:uncharacterized protein LOC131597303 [Vicia villosa]|uniref:uncharacterized protein LOC131597303 n=1 Tax=Vicia villosa TaxID=3911 RepID=UPI00273BFBDD|nr:uncharacterized protein LOC131597303 [Vicia villosa]
MTSHSSAWEAANDATKRVETLKLERSKNQQEYEEYVKGSVLLEYLPHQSIEDYQSIGFDFPDENVMYLKAIDCDESLPVEGQEPGTRWGLVFYGASNACGHGVGAIIITRQGSHIPFTTRICFDCTNNVVEYEACILGLEEAIDLRIKNLDVYGNSTLVIIQIKGEWETRHLSLIPSKDYARRLLSFFKKNEFYHIPRDETQIADALAIFSFCIG